MLSHWHAGLDSDRQASAAKQAALEAAVADHNDRHRAALAESAAQQQQALETRVQQLEAKQLAAEQRLQAELAAQVGVVEGAPVSSRADKMCPQNMSVSVLTRRRRRRRSGRRRRRRRSGCRQSWPGSGRRARGWRRSSRA